MGGIEHGHALLIQVFDRIEDGAPGLRVDAHCGLIHEQQRGLWSRPTPILTRRFMPPE